MYMYVNEIKTYISLLVYVFIVCVEKAVIFTKTRINLNEYTINVHTDLIINRIKI